MAKTVRDFVKNSLNSYYKNFQVKMGANADPSIDNVHNAIRIANDGSIYIHDAGGFNGYDDNVQNASTLQELLKQDSGGGTPSELIAGNALNIETNKIIQIGYIQRNDFARLSDMTDITRFHAIDGSDLTKNAYQYKISPEEKDIAQITKTIRIDHLVNFELYGDMNGETILGVVKDAANGDGKIIAISLQNPSELIPSKTDNPSFIPCYCKKYNLENNKNIIYVTSHIYNSSFNNCTFGSDNFNYAQNANIEGVRNYIDENATGSHAEGYYNTINSKYSHAEGCKTEASGEYSHTEGHYTKTTQPYAHAEGYQSVASSIASHAEGYYTKTTQPYAHAEGQSTTASGSNSHAEGHHTTTSGRNSHAEGYNTTASGYASHVEGIYNKTNNNAEHAEGQYNQSHEGTIHSIGIGTSNENRKNAFEVMQDGSIYVYGLGNYDGSTLSDASTLQKICNSKADKTVVNNLDTSIRNLNSSIFTINASISDISTAIDNLKIRIPYIIKSGNYSIQIEPNLYYVWDPSGNAEIIKDNANSDSAYLNEYRIRVICHNSVNNLKFSNWGNLMWENGIDPTKQDVANMTFEFTIVDNYASYKKYGMQTYDVIIDGADYSCYRDQNSEYQYPTYLNTVDDYISMANHTIPSGERYEGVKAIQTLSNDIAIIIPYNKEIGDVSILDNNNNTIATINISQDMYDTEYEYNDKTCCTAAKIFEGDFNEYSEMHIYHVSPSIDTYWLQTNGAVENRIAGHIIELTNISNPTYIKFENKYGDYGNTYEYVILPARYPHITSLYIDQKSGSELQHAKLKYDDGAQYVNLPTIASFTDRNIYNERYEVDAKMALINDSSILLHLSYSITGNKEIDDIIISNASDFITGVIDKDQMISNIQAEIGNIGTDYATFVIGEYINDEGIEKLFAKYGDTIHDLLNNIQEEQPLSGFICKYVQDNGFLEDIETYGLQYPNQSITFSKDYAAEDDMLPFVNSVLIKIDPHLLEENFGTTLNETEFTIHFDSYDTQKQDILVYPYNEQTIVVSYDDLLLQPNNITE